MPLYDFVCDDCGAHDDIMCSYVDLPKEFKCKECEAVMRREFGFSMSIIHNCTGPQGVKHARIKHGGSAARNTTKGFETNVYDPQLKKNKHYSRYYMDNTPQADPRVAVQKMENDHKKKGKGKK